MADPLLVNTSRLEDGQNLVTLTASATVGDALAWGHLHCIAELVARGAPFKHHGKGPAFAGHHVDVLQHADADLTRLGELGQRRNAAREAGKACEWAPAEAEERRGIIRRLAEQAKVPGAAGGGGAAHASAHGDDPGPPERAGPNNVGHILAALAAAAADDDDTAAGQEAPAATKAGAGGLPYKLVKALLDLTLSAEMPYALDIVRQGGVAVLKTLAISITSRYDQVCICVPWGRAARDGEGSWPLFGFGASLAIRTCP